jgi:hypothetical protein
MWRYLMLYSCEVVHVWEGLFSISALFFKLRVWVELVSARYASANIGSNTLSVLQLPRSLPLALSLLLQPIPVLQASQRASLLLHMVSALDRNITLDPRELRPSSEFSFIHLAVEAATFNGSTHYRVVFKAFRESITRFTPLLVTRAVLRPPG